MSAFRRGYLLVVFLIFVFLLPAKTVQAGGHDGSGPVKLKAVVLPYLGYAPFFIAEDEGYFAEQGLEIEFINMQKTAQAVTTLIQGRIDITAGTLWPSQLNAIARGARIKFVANRNYVATTGSTYSGVVARRSLIADGKVDIRALLPNLRISVENSSFSGYLMDKYLNSVGLTLDDAKTVDLTSPVELEAFREGSIDIAIAAEPWVTRIAKEGDGVLWMPAGKVIPGFQWGFILYGPTLLDANPEAGRRFMVAYLKAVRQYNKGKTERNLEILASHTKLGRQLLTEACWPALRNDGRIDFGSLLDFQKWAVGRGLVDREITEDEFWDPTFVEYANHILNKPRNDSE